MMEHEQDNRGLIEVDAELIKAFEAFANTVSGNTNTCMRCGDTLTGMKKIGRCVYAEPCGCRLYQGDVPERWRK